MNMQESSRAPENSRAGLRDRVTRWLARRQVRDGKDVLRTFLAGKNSPRERGEAASVLSIPELFRDLSMRERRDAVRGALGAIREDKPYLAWAAGHVLAAAEARKSWRALCALATGHLNRKTRFQVVYTLGMLAEPKAVGTLARILHDARESTKMRALAAEVLGQCGAGSKTAAYTLVKSLHDPAPEVRLFSANALAICGDKAAIPHLKKLLKDRIAVEPYGSMSSEAAHAIRSIETRLQTASRRSVKSAAAKRSG
jgi:HEAT repeat protein